MKRFLLLAAACSAIAFTMAFRPVPAETGPGCNENHAKAALISHAPYQACAAQHHPNGIAYAVSATPPRNGECTYDIYAFDPFRCPPNQPCPLVLIAPFAHATVDASYNVTLLECFNF